MRLEHRKMEHEPTWAPSQTSQAQFGGSWQMTLDKLERETDHLRIVGPVIVQVTGWNVKFNVDGGLSARSTLDSPVIVEFETEDHGYLVFRSGKYHKWQSNVHAVVLNLQRLREIDAYGCSQGGEQYTGWAQLPARAVGGDAPGYVLAMAAGFDPTDASNDLRGTFREAVRNTHPDTATDPGPFTFDQVMDAARILGVA